MENLNEKYRVEISGTDFATYDTYDFTASA